MARADYDSILDTLPYLNNTQLEEIRKRVSLNKQRNSASRRVDSLETEDWIFEGIKTELSRRGVAETLDFVVKKTNSFRNFQTKSERVRRLLEQAAPGLTLVQRHYLGEIAVFELAKHIESWAPRNGEKLLVSMDTLLWHVDRIPQVLDYCFPGYIESRTLGVIVTHHF